MMKNIVANDRLRIDDQVSWVSVKGNQYSGKIVSIREGKTCKGDLVTVDVGGAAYRNFYENEVWYEVEE